MEVARKIERPSLSSSSLINGATFSDNTISASASRFDNPRLEPDIPRSGRGPSVSIDSTAKLPANMHAEHRSFFAPPLIFSCSLPLRFGLRIASLTPHKLVSTPSQLRAISAKTHSDFSDCRERRAR